MKKSCYARKGATGKATLLYKELRLALHPTSAVFACMGCLGSYIAFLNARETNDAWYTSILPVTKRESVLGKFLLVSSMQVFQLLLSVPFAFLRGALRIPNNPVGLDATLAWYGFGLVLYALFDLAFPTAFYSSGYKVGKSFVVAAVPMLILMVAMESCAHVPALAWLDSCRPEHLRMQAPLPITGAACYIATLTLAYRISASRYERVDL